LRLFRKGGSFLGGTLQVVEGDGPAAKAFRAAHGSCQSCGRYVETRTRQGETTRRAITHSTWLTVPGMVDRQWEECPGSGRVIP
jgi:hypothetical protein